MASHRRPRTRTLRSATHGSTGVGVTTAALASLTLLSQTAEATPGDDGTQDKPSIEEVKKRVDKLYRQAGSATQQYNAAKERTEKQREKVDTLLDQVAQRAGKINEARRTLGRYAAAQYRSGGMSGTATLLLSKDPQGYFSGRHVQERAADRQQHAVTDLQRQQRAAGKKRAEATRQLSSLSTAQQGLRQSKKAVQGKLSAARQLLSKLTEEEKARLAAIERRERAEARRKAKERAEAERRRQEQEKKEQREEQDGGGSPPGGGEDTGSDPGGGSYAAKAAKVIDFAEGQLGKPYVWGATGPASYDCSGLTQAAWKEGGVSLPRTTFDQVEAGRTVPRSEMLPGDLVFFYDDVSHVGIYVGDGRMIHAPKPGESIRYESVDYMPFHSAVRPA